MTEKCPVELLSSQPKQKVDNQRPAQTNHSPKPKPALSPNNERKTTVQNCQSKKKQRSYKKDYKRSSKKAPNYHKEQPTSTHKPKKISKMPNSQAQKKPSLKSKTRRVSMGNPAKQGKQQPRSNHPSSRRSSKPRSHSPKRQARHRNRRHIPRATPIWELSGYPREYYEPVRSLEKPPPPPPPLEITPRPPAMERNTLPLTKISKPVLCDVEYVALFLMPEAVQTLKEFLLRTDMCPLPDHSVNPPHVTLWFRPSATQAANYKTGHNCGVKIVGFAKHELIQAVQVELLDKSLKVENRIPHVTIFVQEEIPPWYSNGLLEMSSITKVDKGPVLQTVVGKRHRDGKTVPDTVFKNENFSFYEKLRQGGIHLENEIEFMSPSIGISLDPAVQDVGRTIVTDQYWEALPQTAEQLRQSRSPSRITLDPAAVLKPQELNIPCIKKGMKVRPNTRPSQSDNVIKKHHRTPKTLDKSRDEIYGEAGEVWKQIRKRRKMLTVDELKELLPTPITFGKDFRIWPRHGLISMMFAKTGRTELVKYLVNDLGFDVNQQRPKDFCTMLHVAAYYEDVNMLTVQTLIDLGADPLIKNAYGEIPLVSKKVGKKRFSKIQKAHGKQQIQQLAETINQRKSNNQERKFGKPPNATVRPIHKGGIFVPVIPPIFPVSNPPGTNLSPSRSPLVNTHTFYKPPPGTRPHPAKRRTRKRNKRKNKTNEQSSPTKLPMEEKIIEVEVTTVDTKDVRNQVVELIPKSPPVITFNKSNDNDSSSTLRLSTAPSSGLSLSLPTENINTGTPDIILHQGENQTKVEDQSNKISDQETGEAKSSPSPTQKPQEAARESLANQIVLGKRNDNMISRDLFGDHRESSDVEDGRGVTSNDRESEKEPTFAEDLQFFDDLA